MENGLSLALVTPSLGIGGVETYLCRLAEGLVDRGHRVTIVLAERGEYADRAERAGAELLRVPFDGGGLREAAGRLSERGVHLVHGHNYRAARFAHRLAAQLDATYLMSVHGPRPWWKRAFFRAWSDPVVVMSEADRIALIGAFGVPRERTVLSFYGIDTDRFNPEVDGSGFRRELGLGDDTRLVVHVSRFSNRKIRPALAVLKALPLVRHQVGDIVLALVGDGPGLESVGEGVEKLNREAGSDVARILGARTDIPAIMAAADTAVGAANAAMEAIASGVPTIAFGRTGYFGRVRPENFAQAEAVCFGDHGTLRDPEIESVSHDLTVALSQDLAMRNAESLAALIADRYSSDRMAEHIESIYRELVGSRSSAASHA